MARRSSRHRPNCEASTAWLAEFRRDVDCRALRGATFKPGSGCRCFGCDIRERLACIEADYASGRH
jgi:hypothetical protein